MQKKNKTNLIFKSLKIFSKKLNLNIIKIDKYNQINLKDIKKNFVVVKVRFSNLNFKDILMVKGHSGLVKQYPHTPGIDMSGNVYFSKSKKYKKNDKVFIIAKPLGTQSQGGFSEYIVVHENWLELLPKKYSLRDIMLIGTSGYSAMKSFKVGKKIIMKNLKKPVLVTGASGNVGLVLTLILLKNGIQVEALASNANAQKILRKIGVKKIHKTKSFLVGTSFNLMNEKYSVIFDNLGGQILDNSLKFLIKCGKLISIGNILGNNSKINILPFILREIKIEGINAENLKNSERDSILKYLISKNIVTDLKRYTKTIKLNKVPSIIKSKIMNKNKSRYVVQI